MCLVACRNYFESAFDTADMNTFNLSVYTTEPCAHRSSADAMRACLVGINSWTKSKWAALFGPQSEHVLCPSNKVTRRDEREMIVSILTALRIFPLGLFNPTKTPPVGFRTSHSCLSKCTVTVIVCTRWQQRYSGPTVPCHCH